MSNDNVLHIFGQAYSHGESWIVGDYRALTNLRDALQRATVTEKPISFNSFTSDGEGYTVIVLPLPLEVIEEQLLLPFRWLEAEARAELQGEGSPKHPSSLVGVEAYKRLMQCRLPCCGGSYDGPVGTAKEIHTVICPHFKSPF